MIIESDPETLSHVLIAVDLRLTDLSHIEATGRLGSLCREQSENLERFARDLRKELFDVLTSGKPSDS